MEVKIKKFMELQNVDFITPCEISGKTGSGKTTLLRAALYVLSGKDFDGSTFSENVYPANPATANDCFADVTVILEGRTFRKETNAKEVRAAGEIESKIVKSIATKYYIDGQIVDKSSYDGEIKKYTAGKDFQLFVNPAHFAVLKVEDKRDIFADYFDFKVFNSPTNITTIRNSIVQTKVKYNELNIAIKTCLSAPKPEPITDNRAKLSTQIAKIQDIIKNNSFILQPDEVAHNNKVAEQIAQLRLQQPEKLELLESTPLLSIADSSTLHNLLKNLYEKQADTTVFDLQIEKLEKEQTNYESLKNQIENYDSSLAGAKCNVCPICTLDNCPQKVTDLRSLEDLQFEFSLLEQKNWNELILTLKSNKAIKISEFEAEKADKIKNIEESIKEIEAKNIKIEIENAKIAEENAKNEAKNLLLQQNHKIEVEKFEAEKQNKIKALEASMIVAKQTDNVENYLRLAEWNKEFEANQVQIDAYNMDLGFYELSLKKAAQLEIDLAQLRIELSKKEREEILYRDAEVKYYTELQDKINSVLPAGFSLQLFEKNKSNDTINLKFDLLFNKSVYFSNGQKEVAFAQLCKLFQTKSGVDFPIFIDESAILDSEHKEKIFALKNIAIVHKSDDKLTIKKF